ncbi:MAG: LrgB family protein, partial [Rhizobiales bacterium]|nr:LrgB family protein [Hyphomicrobiales bacterium]
MNEFSEIWVYLRTTPLMHLTLTLVAYQIGNWIYKKTNLNPLFNPVLIAMIIIVPILLFSKTNYSEYFQGAQFVHFLLGPATVALAIPLYQQFEKVKKSATAISISIFTGSLTA